ncbi:hypothetical protein GF402_05605 [Candidatus Fermentibacteria bacterium]|nr:hypothetical protein [Candidatus Fermentibacteria bacterium]
MELTEAYSHGCSLAPMAGITDSAFRRLCRELGADSVVTEMVSATGLARGSARSGRLIRFEDRESPIGVQLFGHLPRDFERAAALVSEMGFSFVDVNAGCPTRKVVRRGSGAALLDDVPLLLDVVEATARGGNLPVTTKIRLGSDPDRPVPESLPTDLARSGCRAIAVHGRYVSNGFAGPVDHNGIARLARISPVPVLANGDSTGTEAVKRLILLSGASGVLLGRGAARNPWIFRELSEAGKGRPGPGELRRLARRQMRMMSEYMPERRMLLKLRGYLARYLRGFPGASGLRSLAVAVCSRKDVERVLDLAEERIHCPETEAVCGRR